MIGQKRRQRW